MSKSLYAGGMRGVVAVSLLVVFSLFIAGVSYAADKAVVPVIMKSNCTPGRMTPQLIGTWCDTLYNEICLTFYANGQYDGSGEDGWTERWAPLSSDQALLIWTPLDLSGIKRPLAYDITEKTFLLEANNFAGFIELTNCLYKDCSR